MIGSDGVERLTDEQWRERGVKCEALCVGGRKCHGWRKYGRLCGRHYHIAESDIDRVSMVPRSLPR